MAESSQNIQSELSIQSNLSKSTIQNEKCFCRCKKNVERKRSKQKQLLSSCSPQRSKGITDFA